MSKYNLNNNLFEHMCVLFMISTYKEYTHYDNYKIIN